MLDAIGLKVSRLIRVAYGPFELGELQPGAVAEVPPARLKALSAALAGGRDLNTALPKAAPPAERTPGAAGDARPRTGAAPRKPGQGRPGRPGAPRVDDAKSGRSKYLGAKTGRAKPAGAASWDSREAKPEAAKKPYKSGWARPKPKAASFQSPGPEVAAQSTDRKGAR